MTESVPECPAVSDLRVVERTAIEPIPSPLVPTDEDFDGRIVMSPRT